MVARTSHLLKIADAFHFKLDREAPLEKQQDFCMEQVLEICGQSKWEYTVGCEDALSELTDTAGRSVLIRALELCNAKLSIGFALRRIAVLVVNADGDTALHTAARTGHAQCIATLCLSLSLDKKNLKGETANDIIVKSKKVYEVYNRLEGLVLGLFMANRYTEALEVYRQIHFILETHYPTVSRKHVVIENMICCLLTLKRSDEALELMEKNFLWKQSFYGENSPVMAQTRTSLGIWFLEKGKYEDALEEFGRSLQAWEKVRGKNALVMAPVLNSMSVCYMKLGKHAEAIESKERGLFIERQHLDNNDLYMSQTNLCL